MQKCAMLKIKDVIEMHHKKPQGASKIGKNNPDGVIT